ICPLSVPQAPLVPGHAGMKFTVLETLDHIKEEFQLFQAQYHSLKLECEKLATEKTEMHRHYIMYYEMSYGLNIEMQKQAEIVKRLSAICTQIIPLLSQEHQHQVAQAVERSKHVSMADLNAIIGQQQLQHLSHHTQGFPLAPHHSGLSLGAGGLMALPAAFPFPPHLAPKDDLTHPESVDPRGTELVMLISEELLMGFCIFPQDSEVDKNEDSLRRDSTKEKSVSPAGASPRSADGNGLDGSPVRRRNTSRETHSPSSPTFPHPHTPSHRKSPTQEKTRSPSQSPSRDTASPVSASAPPPPPPSSRPLSSPARAPSPPVQH
uniref:TLE family member 2, transcriptional corepressor c n=1 Tax=Astyanax mexicanus TaxID=7994 RepID=W5KXV2_ASTMX